LKRKGGKKKTSEIITIELEIETPGEDEGKTAIFLVWDGTERHDHGELGRSLSEPLF